MGENGAAAAEGGAWDRPGSLVDGGNCVKKLVAAFKKLNLLIVGAVVLVLVLIVGGFVILTGGSDDGGETTGPDASAGIASGGDRGTTGSGRRVKPAPIVTSGVIDEARRIGRSAVAQARGIARTPSRISVRISAAPKQTVSVNWQLGCVVNRRVAYGRGTYRARTPDIRTLNLPASGASQCTVTASAQLTRRGDGRVKVAAIAG